MRIKKTLSGNDIVSIDFDIKIDSDTFFQSTMSLSSTRAKIYYCFKNIDTREDGESRCSIETFKEISENFIQYCHNDSNSETDIYPSIKCNIVLHMLDNNNLSFNECNISACNLKHLVNLLSSKVDEFVFFTAFLSFI